MYELYDGETPFTKWAVEHHVLCEPFVLIDIGCKGGIHPRWRAFGEYLETYGFDPLAEEIERLRNTPVPGRYFYYAVALGNEDGERDFYFSSNEAASSFFASPPTELRDAHIDNRRSTAARQVPIRKLDTVYAQHPLPAADFLKIDCEGFEIEVLKGATRYLKESRVFGIECETSFAPSIHLPNTHIGHLIQSLTHEHFNVFDIAFNRTPRRAFTDYFERCGRTVPEKERVGPICTVNALFCQDYVNQRINPDDYSGLLSHQFMYVPPSPSKVLKGMMVFESYGLNDCAYELMMDNKEALGTLIDIEEAAHLLAHWSRINDSSRGPVMKGLKTKEAM